MLWAQGLGGMDLLAFTRDFQRYGKPVAVLDVDGSGRFQPLALPRGPVLIDTPEMRRAYDKAMARLGRSRAERCLKVYLDRDRERQVDKAVVVSCGPTPMCHTMESAFCQRLSRA